MKKVKYLQKIKLSIRMFVLISTFVKGIVKFNFQEQMFAKVKILYSIERKMLENCSFDLSKTHSKNKTILTLFICSQRTNTFK